MTRETTRDGGWGIGSYAVAWATGVSGFPQPRSPMGPADLIALAVEQGAHMVQTCDNMPLIDMSGDELQSLAAQAADTGVVAEVGTRSYLTDTLLAYLEVAVQLRSPLVRTLLDGPASGTECLFYAAEASLRKGLPEYERRRVVLAVENYEGYRCADLAALIDRTDSPCLGVCLDTVNSLGAPEPLDRVVELLASHTLSFHLKDFRIRRHPHAMVSRSSVPSPERGDLTVGVSWMGSELPAAQICPRRSRDCRLPAPTRLLARKRRKSARPPSY